MGIIVNQSIRNATISYIGIVIGFISTIKLFPNILDTDQFGLTRVMIAIVTISAQFVNLGITNSIIKFFPSLSEKTDNPQGLFWAFFTPPLVSLIIYGGLIILFKDFVIELYKDDSALIGEYYFYLIPLICFLSAFAILTAFEKAFLKTVFPSFLQEILLRIIVIVDLVLFYFDWITFNIFILIFVLNYGFQFLLLVVGTIKNGHLNLKPVFNVFDSETFKEIRNFSFYSFFSGFTLVLLGNIDLIMVGTFEGLSQTGIYAIALYVVSVINIPKKAVSKISFPIISNSFKNGDMTNILNVYKQSSLNQFLIGGLIFIGVLANIDNLYTLLPKEYATGSIVIIIIGAANLFDLITGANGQIIISSKYYRFDFYSSFILMGTAIIFNLILIPRYGILGAAIATSTSIVINNLIKLIYVWIRLKMHPFKIEIFGIIFTGSLLLYLSSLVPSAGNVYLDIFLRSASITLLFFGSVWFFKLSNEVNNTIVSILKRFKSLT